MSYTKGPWFVDGKRNIWGHINNENVLIAQCCDMPCINGFDDLAAERGSDMERANDILMAAAPDLLEAAKFWLSSYDENGPCITEAADKLRAAIQRAEGSA